MEDITVQELKKRLEGGETLQILDVREPYEYEEVNINGKLIPLGQLQGSIQDLEDWADLEIIVHCRSGARSAAAKDYLIKQGFTNVRNLTGGILAYLNI